MQKKQEETGFWHAWMLGAVSLLMSTSVAPSASPCDNDDPDFLLQLHILWGAQPLAMSRSTEQLDFLFSEPELLQELPASCAPGPDGLTHEVSVLTMLSLVRHCCASLNLFFLPHPYGGLPSSSRYTSLAQRRSSRTTGPSAYGAVV